MKLKSFLLFLAIISANAIGQDLLSEPHWLVILEGHQSIEKAQEAQAKYDYEANLLLSVHYENLNQGWYILAFTFQNKEAALAKNKALKAMGAKSYVKYSGHLRQANNSLEENVKFVLENGYVVIGEVPQDFSYEGRSHQLEIHPNGTPVDLYSEIRLDELPPGCLPWQKEGFYYFRGDDVLEKAQGIRFFILSRIQMESYRPGWCFEADDPYACINREYEVPEEEIMQYVWRNSYQRYLVAQTEEGEGMLALFDPSYLPRIYEEIEPAEPFQDLEKLLDSLPESKAIQEVYEESLRESVRMRAPKWYQSDLSTYSSRMLELDGDTLFMVEARIIDTPCGGDIDDGFAKTWRLSKGQLQEIDPTGVDFELIFRFDKTQQNFIYRINHNSNSMEGLDGEESISLPYDFEDPWEC